jgi:hypothetical protein
MGSKNMATLRNLSSAFGFMVIINESLKVKVNRGGVVLMVN